MSFSFVFKAASKTAALAALYDQGAPYANAPNTIKQFIADNINNMTVNAGDILHVEANGHQVVSDVNSYQTGSASIRVYTEKVLGL